jgi:hypothetical protein
VDVQYFLHFANEVIVGGGAIDLRAKGDGDNVRDCNESNLHARVVPVGVLHGICLEGNFGPEFCGDFVVLADCIAGADVVLVNLKKAGELLSSNMLPMMAISSFLLLKNGVGL